MRVQILTCPKLKHSEAKVLDAAMRAYPLGMEYAQDSGRSKPGFTQYRRVVLEHIAKDVGLERHAIHAAVKKLQSYGLLDLLDDAPRGRTGPRSCYISLLCVLWKGEVPINQVKDHE